MTPTDSEMKWRICTATAMKKSALQTERANRSVVAKEDLYSFEDFFNEDT